MQPQPFSLSPTDNSQQGKTYCAPGMFLIKYLASYNKQMNFFLHKNKNFRKKFKEIQL